MGVGEEVLNLRRQRRGEADVRVEGADPVAPRVAGEQRARSARSSIAAEVLAAREERRRRLQSPETMLRNVGAGAVIGGGAGAVTGFGAVPGAVLGAVTGAFGTKVAQATDSEVMGMAAEVVADPVLPAARMGARALTSASRAAGRLQRAGFPEALGSEGAEGVADVVRGGVAAMKQDVGRAYDLAREAAPVGAAVAPEMVAPIVGPRRFKSIVEEYDDPAWTPETWLDWDKLDRVRRGLGDAEAAARRAGKLDEARRLGERKNKLDAVFDELARQVDGPPGAPTSAQQIHSGSRSVALPGQPARVETEYAQPGTEALDALRTARQRNVEYRSVLPQRGKPSQLHMRGVAGPKEERFDKASDWFHKILIDKKGGRLTAYRQAKDAARRVGRGDELDRELRTAYLQWLPQIQAGGPTPSAVHGAPTIARKFAATDDLAELIFTSTQVEFLRENINALSQMAAGDRLTKSVAIRGPVLQYLRTALVAGGAGYATTNAAVGGAVAAGAGATYVVQKIAELYGPKMARELAVRALYDSNLMAKLAKQAAPQEATALARRAAQSAVRRGLLVAEDIAHMDQGE